MRVEWHGQSAFRCNDGETTVFIDPFGDMSAARERGMTWDYPPIEVDGVDLLLVTHEHVDHNGVEAIAGDPAVLRATAGRHESPVGEVLGIASEHDDAAGTERGQTCPESYTPASGPATEPPPAKRRRAGTRTPTER